LSKWVQESALQKNLKTIQHDVEHSARALKSTSDGANALHTVCAVMLMDVEAANAALPSPVNSVTARLSQAYTLLGTGANDCYGASTTPALRTDALLFLQRGLGVLSQAQAIISNQG
jgi:hypothetical protein